ncbi:MAG TPA: ligase-associated DNA damage response exonuclease [Kiloniellales bacterium]|nr:ligase-associated DNA damage response exonuclease [Kiloniellales bacterium]
MKREAHPENWLQVTGQGLYCGPGDFFIDPPRSVERAVITHGHADHARPGHGWVLATPHTLAIMRTRFGERAGGRLQALDYGEPRRLREVTLRLVPAGHVLGSAQVVIEWGGWRVVISGDYKRQLDPTCQPFEVVPCDVFVTEATFGLPVFRHPPADEEIARLLHSVDLFPDRSHLVGVYALGKAQRVIALLRRAGWERPLYLHGALQPLCRLYQEGGVDLGELHLASGVAKGEMAGEIILAPPAALSDRWSRRFPDPVAVLASGWMRVRQRARQRGVELPLVISDHADWDELTLTLQEVQAGEVWVTHGSEEALIHWARLHGIRGRALSLIGRGEEEQEQEQEQEEPP